MKNRYLVPSSLYLGNHIFKFYYLPSIHVYYIYIYCDTEGTLLLPWYYITRIYISLGKAIKYNSVAARNLLLYSLAFCIVDSADLKCKSCKPSLNKFSARLMKL